MSNLAVATIPIRPQFDTSSSAGNVECLISPEENQYILGSHYRGMRYPTPVITIGMGHGVPHLVFDHQSVNPYCETEQATNPKLSTLNVSYEFVHLQEDSYEILVDPDLVVRMPPKRRRKIVFKVLNRRRGEPSAIGDYDIMWDSDDHE